MCDLKLVQSDMAEYQLLYKQPSLETRGLWFVALAITISRLCVPTRSQVQPRCKQWLSLPCDDTGLEGLDIRIR